MSDYEAAKGAKRTLEAASANAWNAVKAIPGVGGGPMGLTSDAVKVSCAYIHARHRAEHADTALSKFMRVFRKVYGKRWDAETRQSIAEKRARCLASS